MYLRNGKSNLFDFCDGQIICVYSSVKSVFILVLLCVFFMRLCVPLYFESCRRRCAHCTFWAFWSFLIWKNGNHSFKKKKKKKFKSAVSKNILARAKIAATLHEQPFELREWVDSTLWRWLLSKENLGGIKQRAITACQKAPREGRFAKSKCMQSLMPINYVMGGRALELLVCVVDHLWCILSLMSAWSSGALPLNYSHAATFTSEELHWMIAHFFSVSLFL